MALAAAQVIDAVVARVAPLAAIGGRVSASRTWPWDQAELPACRVFATAEAVQPTSVGDRVGQHTLDVEVAFSVRAVADLDDQMHALAAGALPLIFAEPVPYGLQLIAINRRLQGDGEAAVGVISLDLQATFFAAAAAPETIL